MNNLSISQKLTLLLAPLLVCVLVYTGLDISNGYKKSQGLSDTKQLIEFSVSLGELTHNLQVERGSTFGFIQSGGVKFASDLPVYRSHTDQSLRTVENQYAALRGIGLPASVSNSVDGALNGLAMLEETRKAATLLNIVGKEAASRYTQAIALIQKTNPAIADQSQDLELTKLMTSYNAFLNLKERSGQERALMTGVFTANQFEAAQYPLFLSHIAAQTAYLHIYDDYASEVMKKRYQQALETPAFLQVEAMRKVAIEKAFSGDFGIEPTAWFASMTSRINSMHEIEKELAEQIKSLADQKSNQAKRTLIMISLLGMVILTVSIGFSYWVCTSITSAVKMLNSTIGQIQRNKDLTLGLPVLGNDEIGQVAAALNGLMDNFRQSIGQVTISALNVLHCSESIASTSSQLASGTSRLSNSAAAMAAAIEEMGASIEQVADNAKQVQVITAESSELSELGTNVILKVETEMNGIADAVRQASIKMQELDKQSTEINSIIQVIREIADQTNLLALNASIEAARAGEQGRGFAVVADEVRSLSARTTNSAQEIATMIHKMQTVTRDAVTSMNIGVEKVNNEVTTTHNAGESIKKIQSASQQVTIAVMDICNAINEQSKASHEIGRQVERVAQMSEESYAASNSNAETAKEMKVLASHLQTIVASFKVSTL